MRNSSTFRTAAGALVLAAVATTSSLPATAAPQRAQARSAAVATPGHGPGPVSYSYAYPYYWRSIWWASYGHPWGLYGYYGYPYAYPFPYAYFPADVTAAVRLQVTPREAEVFVDGYRAGEVDDFDGVFQRLRLQPGGHDVRPGGESPIAPERSGGEDRRLFGTLSLRVQPADADILIDDQRWAIPTDAGTLSIELAQGRHTVEVRKSGFSTYRETVLIRPGATLRVNVGLTQ